MIEEISGTIGGIMDAAKLADELSVRVGSVGRSIEIVALPEDFEVRGETWVGGIRHSHTHLLPYRVFWTAPIELADAVRYVDKALRDVGEPSGGPEV